LHLRGPANGSRVIYALGLSQVLPQRGLLFERFIDLNNQKVYVVLESDPGQAAQVRKIVHELLGIKFEVKDWGVRVSWGRQNGNAEPRLEIDIVKHPDVGTLCRALTMVNPSADRQLILEQLPENDPETLALLSRGETEGVSLFCSEGMQDFLRQLKPVNFEDLAAAYALYRPGPLESGLAQAYLDRDSSNRWPEFPGGGRFLIYQENVMHLFQAAGMSLSDSRRFQKAWCMRKRAEADLLLAAFTQNAKKQGLSEGWALGFVDVLKRYTHHAFCKAHAAGDANLGYQMAFIKAHYPEEFEEARKQTRQNENGAQPE
jgi:DNA polymerase III alpha subunit